MTCIAFSIAKPFRKKIHTNIPYIIALTCLVVFDILLLWLPDNSMSQFFGVLPFEDDDGNKYYGYKGWMTLAIILNSAMTYGAEKIIVEKVTKGRDRKIQRKK